MDLNTILGFVGANFDTTNDQRTTAWINDAVGQIVGLRQWSWRESRQSFTLTNGQRDYVLYGTTPIITDYGGWIKCAIELDTTTRTEIDMTFLDPQLFQQVGGHSKTVSEPLFCTVRGATAKTTSATIVPGGEQVLSFLPIPKASLGFGWLNYYRSVSSVQLVANADQPIVPIQHHYAIVHLATSIGKEEVGDMDEAIRFRALHDARMNVMIAEDVGMKFGDNQRLELIRPPSLNPQVGYSPATYQPEARPLPAAAS